MDTIGVPNIEEIESFSDIINDLVDNDNISYIEAVTEYCDMSGVEIELAAKLLTPMILSKINEEAYLKKLITRTPMLPI